MQQAYVLTRQLCGARDLVRLEGELNRFVREIEADALVLVGPVGILSGHAWPIAIATVRRGTIPPLTGEGPRPYYTLLPPAALAGRGPAADTDGTQGV